MFETALESPRESSNMKQALCRSNMLCVALSSLGCTKEFAPSANSSSKTAEVVSAAVLLERPHAKPDDLPIEIAFTADEARQLEQAFYGRNQGTKIHGDFGFDWAARVDLKYDDGSVERLVTNFNGCADAEGRFSSVGKNAKRLIAGKLGHLDAKTRRQLLELLGVEPESAPNYEFGGE